MSDTGHLFYEKSSRYDLRCEYCDISTMDSRASLPCPKDPVRLNTDPRIRQARLDGARARWDGFTLDDCPYDRVSYARAWEDGWGRHAELIPPSTDGSVTLSD